MYNNLFIIKVELPDKNLQSFRIQKAFIINSLRMGCSERHRPGKTPHHRGRPGKVPLSRHEFQKLDPVKPAQIFPKEP
jgi:hypothetical protein